MKKIQQILLAGIMMFSMGTLAIGATTPSYADGAAEALKGAKTVNTGGSNTGSVEQIAKTITNVLLFLIGVISVIMIVIGGIKYTTSNGDSNRVTAAKNTIMYAIIGIIVAILAYAVVNFVLTSLAPGTTTTPTP